MRGSYKRAHIQSTTVVPFYARSRFSLSGDHLGERLMWAESVVVEWLGERGIRVLPPDRTRDQLVQAKKWEHFTGGGLLRRDLSNSFESAARPQQKESQTQLVRELRAGGEFGTRYVLFGELLYHTTGTCRTRGDQYTDRARVVIAKDAADTLPRPCVVTHFQARLVDADTGTTVWYNRRMRELHARKVEDSHERENIRQVVQTTIAGSDGLGKIFAANNPG